MNIAIYHPHLHLLGGGEVVALRMAYVLAKTHKVTILTHSPVDKAKLEAFYGYSLPHVAIVVHPIRLSMFKGLQRHITLRSMYTVFERYDLVIDTATNGWVDRPLHCKTLAYIHFPEFARPKRGLRKVLNAVMVRPQRAFCYDRIICNSKFTQDVVRSYTSRDTRVIYPPVAVERITPKQKRRIIVSIGRFTPEKKQDVLLEAWRQVAPHSSYTLHLVGTRQKDAEGYRLHLENLAKGLPVIFHDDLPHSQVLSLLEEADIYWHARGAGETQPETFENFGITTVEAMAAGCAVVTINKGAQPELVTPGISGYLWNSVPELVSITQSLIAERNAIGNKQRSISLGARAAAMTYSEHIFDKCLIDEIEHLDAQKVLRRRKPLLFLR